jgi:Bacterial Ig-like domain
MLNSNNMRRILLLLTFVLTISACQNSYRRIPAPPIVVEEVVPTEASLGVDRSVVLRVKFDKYVLPSSVTNQNLTLTLGTQSVPVNFEVHQEFIRITPTQLLQPNTEYKVSLDSSILGNSSQSFEGKTWSFTTGEAGWQGATTLATDASKLDFDLSMNSAGQAMITWVQTLEDIYRLRGRRYSLANGWSEPETVFYGYSTYGIFAPRIALDDQGRVATAWIRKPRPLGDPLGGQFEVMGAFSSTLDISGWAEPVVLGSLRRIFDLSDDLHLQLNPSGDGVAAWSQYNTISTANFIRADGWSLGKLLRSANSVSSEIADLSLSIDVTKGALLSWVDDRNGLTQSIKVNAMASIGAAWKEVSSFPVDDSDAQPQAKYSPISHKLIIVWNGKISSTSCSYELRAMTPPDAFKVLIPCSGKSPQIGFDAQGRALFLFSNGWQAAVWNSDGTITPTVNLYDPIESDIYFVRDSKLAVAENGNAVAMSLVSYRDKTVKLFANYYSPQHGWGAPRQLSGLHVSLEVKPKLAIDAQGHALLAWVEVEGGQKLLKMESFK